jgi:hypothetical protein
MVQFIPRWIEKRVIILVAAFVSFIGFIFVGPSEIFGLPNSLLLMGIG